MNAAAVTGGCQCGAIRFAVEGGPQRPSICHCRMCQKAFGAPFAALFEVKRAAFRLTHGELAVYRSSDLVERGFCRNCGTPLTIQDSDSDAIDVAIGALDDPAQVAPLRQVGTESRLPGFAGLPHLPGRSTDDNDRPDRLQRIVGSNHQHPDHDTASWTPRPSETGSST